MLRSPRLSSHYFFSILNYINYKDDFLLIKLIIICKVLSTTHTKYRLQIHIKFFILFESVVYVIQYVLATIIRVNSGIQIIIPKAFSSEYFNPVYCCDNYTRGFHHSR